MKFAVIVFPGSNCDLDMLWAIKNVCGAEAEYVRHDATSLEGFDGVFLPGGFSYGDALRCGAIARFSNIMSEVIRFANEGKMVFGTCNGFQVLTEAGLLPGSLIRNRSLHFVCKTVGLKVVNNETKFTSEYQKDEVIQIPVAHGEGNYYCDEETLAKLKPAFKSDGSVTAGNASGINDGGAALVLASESAVNQLGLTPLAEWQGSAVVGLDPALMGLGPYYAINKLLKNQQMAADDVDTYEINEAFATQALVCQELLHLDPNAVNPWGGAIALGHPVGCSGARIIVTMINEMHWDNHELGIASLCVGGGMGEAVLLKKI